MQLTDLHATVEILNGRLARLRSEALGAAGILRQIAHLTDDAQIETLAKGEDEILRNCVESTRDRDEEESNIDDGADYSEPFGGKDL